jgi:hypothetical protein
MSNGFVPVVVAEVPKGQKPVWVFYRVDTGAVVKVMLREPVQADAHKSEKVAMFQTYLSEKALEKPHLLQVRGGKVIIGIALGGL